MSLSESEKVLKAKLLVQKIVNQQVEMNNTFELLWSLLNDGEKDGVDDICDLINQDLAED
jgi:hypothetical protein